MTETGAEKATRKEDAPANKATSLPEKDRAGREPEKSAGTAASPKSLRSRDLSLATWELAVTGALLVGIIAAVVAGIQTERLWPWIVVAMLVAAVVMVAALHTLRRPGPASPGPRAVPASAAQEPPTDDLKERAEVAPFTVRTSLYSRHLLRLLDRSQPRGQVVVPVSGGHRTQILIEARSEEPVELRDIRPVVTSRRPTRHGEPVVTAEGALPLQHFDLALSEDPPRLVPVEDREGETPSLPISVVPNELELIVLAPRSDDQEIAWHLELDWVCGDRTGTLAVDLGEHPFRVTAETGWTTFYPDGGPPVRTGWD